MRPEQAPRRHANRVNGSPARRLLAGSPWPSSLPGHPDRLVQVTLETVPTTAVQLAVQLAAAWPCRSLPGPAVGAPSAVGPRGGNVVMV